MLPQTEPGLIIERPELQTAVQRVGGVSLTLICWAIWVYLVVPLLSLVAWVVGAHTVHSLMLQNLGVDDLLEKVGYYGAGILALVTVYMTWAMVSFFRYRNMSRRSAPEIPTASVLGATHGLTHLQIQLLRSARRYVVSTEDLERMFSELDEPDALEKAPADSEQDPKAA
ncbi:MAG TPA: poly-beta-1,6-N-acetyl-D-glucosamine biosynthesis protein PgaD [Pseudomonadales bacterium]|jgi:biofilm PGA synthesis protein PgaD